MAPRGARGKARRVGAGHVIGGIEAVGPRALRVALSCLVLGAGCDEPPARHASAAGDPARATEPTATDRAEERATGPRTPDDACAALLADETPERVRATLHVIGYDDVFHDTCLGERAERERDASLCEQLLLPSLARQCVLRVAVAAATPLACPSAADERDPLCVALAARDRRLCAAAGLVDRAVCEEALGREHRCNHLPEEVRGDCDARAVALAALVTGEVTTSPALETSLEVHVGDQATPMSAAAIEHGASVGWSACSPLVRIGDPEALALPFGGGAIAITARVDAPTPATLPLGAIIAGDVGATLELAPPRGRRARASSGQLRMRTLELALGGRIEGTFEASLSGSDVPVEGEFHTFVRDVAPRPASCDRIVPGSGASEGSEAP